MWLGSGQLYQMSVITFRQFQHTDSPLTPILDCFPHLRRRSRAECYNPAGHSEEMGRLSKWKHTLFFFGIHKGLLAGGWIIFFQRLYEGTLTTCSLLDFTSSLWALVKVSWNFYTGAASPSSDKWGGPGSALAHWETSLCQVQNLVKILFW